MGSSTQLYILNLKMVINAAMFFILVLCAVIEPSTCSLTNSTTSEHQHNTVLIVFLARNKAHTLPYFLTQLQNLDYPKSRISLWIRSDHNIDVTIDVLQTWVDQVRSFYHSVSYEYNTPSPQYQQDESGPHHWSEKRFQHMIDLKEEALVYARQMWTDYVWFTDCDTFYTNQRVLTLLMSQQKTLVAPMLESLGAYSNYWCGMNSEYYYKRTDQYMPILERKEIGCFQVPMIHSSVLVDLRTTESIKLSFDPDKINGYDGPTDDIIAFAISAKYSGVNMYIVNVEPMGFIMVPQESDKSLREDQDQLSSLKVEIIVENEPLKVVPPLSKFIKSTSKDKLAFDEVYMINLERRPERRIKMMASFDELGIQATVIDAVDGRELNSSYLSEIGVKMLPEYIDPYHKRPLTMGEIGCFLSHYNIWKDIVEKGYNNALIFEDDIKFEPYFKRKLENLMDEMDKLDLEWELVYLGRKRVVEKSEPLVPGALSVVKVEYSYWTLSYMITRQGAQKLLRADPLSKMVPVDEYLPIMFDKHPEITWKGYYKQRDLLAFSASPLLVFPTHYTGEKDYISDTEDSSIVKDVGEAGASFPASVSTSAANDEL